MISNFTFFLIAYLAGSINFSIILFRLRGKGDPRQKYSKNPGATNVYRQAGKWWALFVLLLDMGRAAVVALAALHFLTPGPITFSGFGLLLGNRYPCFHGFRGGKGVANYLGFSAVIAPMWAGAAILAWIVVFGIARQPFLSSFFMVTLLAIGTVLFFDFEMLPVLGTTLSLVLIFINHKQNVIDFFRAPKEDRK